MIAPIAYRLYLFNDAIQSSDYFLDASSAVISMQVAMHYSTMSASLSYLQPFLLAFDSNLGASTKIETVVGARSSNRQKYAAGSGRWSSNGRNQRSDAQCDDNIAALRERENSEDSKAPIILKTTSVQVDVGNR